MSTMKARKLRKGKEIQAPATPPPMPIPGVLLTPAQLALKLAVPATWIREKCRRRALERDTDPLPRVVLGKYIRFDWDQVQAWIKRQSR
jgi:hypothetical protein